MILQKREKVLLFILFVLIVYGGIGMFFIYPQMTEGDENRIILNQKMVEVDQTKSLIQLTPSYEKQITVMQTEAEELYNLMRQTKGYDVSLMLSDMLASYTLTPVDLTIGEYKTLPVPEELQPPKVEEPVDEKDPYAEQTKILETPEEEVTPYVMMRTADLSFLGTRENALAFLDQINSYNLSVVVSAYVVDTQENLETFKVAISLYEFYPPDHPVAVAQEKMKAKEGE